MHISQEILLKVESGLLKLGASLCNEASSCGILTTVPCISGVIYGWRKVGKIGEAVLKCGTVKEKSK